MDKLLLVNNFLPGKKCIRIASATVFHVDPRRRGLLRTRIIRLWPVE
jgi:hypothetical protein